MLEDLPVAIVVSTLGFVLGAICGGTAQRTNFCTMGAISDIVFMGDFNRFRSWMLATAIAIIGSQGLHAVGLIDLSQSIYLLTTLGWAGAIIGGLMFGFGMTMAGGCGNKTLVRLGSGNLKSLVVAIILGIFAYMTLRGLIGPVRLELEQLTNIDLKAAGIESQAIADILASVIAIEVGTLRLVVAAIFGGGLLIFCFKDPEFRNSPKNIFAGAVFGLAVVAGWYITGVIGNDDFEPVPLASLTFIAPAGEALQYLMTFTGSTINFGIAVIGGVIVGSFVAAKVSGEFRIEFFVSGDDMIRHLYGAALMGTGGVLSLGCTICQGVTGMSTLGLGSLIALVSIVSGAVLGLKYIEEGSFNGALAAVFGRN